MIDARNILIAWAVAGAVIIALAGVWPHFKASVDQITRAVNIGTPGAAVYIHERQDDDRDRDVPLIERDPWADFFGEMPAAVDDDPVAGKLAGPEVEGSANWTFTEPPIVAAA